MSHEAEEVAAALVAARREGRGLTGFPGAHPATMADAYRIQELAMASWPDALAGWKIGYIAPERRAPGEPDRLVGPIWRGQCLTGEAAGSAPELGVFGSGFAAVEAELVVRLTHDLPGPDDKVDWRAEETADLETEVLLGIEVASSPIPDINSLGPTVIAADFGNNNGLVLGDALGEGRASVACYVDGQLLGEGSADNLPGGMHSGLATALNLLAGRGQRVRAGMVFATGALTGIHPVQPGQLCRVEVRGGPSVEVRLSDARPSPSLG
jgi:2-keto-4-pentenoate hydratase